MNFLGKNNAKKELLRLRNTRQLMGIDQVTGHGVKTAAGELVFFLIQPDNLSVLSAEGVRARVMALTGLLRGADSMVILALDSRESFQQNKDWYRARLEKEDNPALRELLRRDMEELDAIQAATASTREFALALSLEQKDGEELRGQITRLEKSIRDGGFRVRAAGEQDIKRILSVYYQQDVTTEYFESCDGEEAVKQDG